MPASQEPDSCAPEDLALVRRARAGDRHALEALARRIMCISRMLSDLNRRRNGFLNEQDLEDLAQDVAVLIWHKIEKFEGTGPLEAWVYRFAQLEFLNRIRIEDRRRKRSGVDGALLESGGLQEAVAPRAGDESAELPEWVSDLPEEELVVVRYKHEESMTFRGISERTGVPANTLKARYYRGLSRIRRRMGGTEMGQ